MIVFYCKDCRKIVDAKRKGDKYEYICEVCGSERVCFGTDKAISDFFQVVVKKAAAVVE
jgi:hypothetical protein